MIPEHNTAWVTDINGSYTTKSNNPLLRYNSSQDVKSSTISDSLTEKCKGLVKNPLQFNVSSKFNDAPKLNDYEKVYAQITTESLAYNSGMNNFSLRMKYNNVRIKTESDALEGDRKVLGRLEIFANTPNKTAKSRNLLSNSFVQANGDGIMGKSPLDVNANRLLKSKSQEENIQPGLTQSAHMLIRSNTGLRGGVLPENNRDNDICSYSMINNRESYTSQSDKKSSKTLQNDTRDPTMISLRFAEIELSQDKQASLSKEEEVNLYSDLVRKQLCNRKLERRLTESNLNLKIPVDDVPMETQIKQGRRRASGALTAQGRLKLEDLTSSDRIGIKNSFTPNNRLNSLSSSMIGLLKPLSANDRANRLQPSNLYNSFVESSTTNNSERCQPNIQDSLKVLSRRALVLTTFACGCDFIRLDPNSKLTRM